MPFIAWLGRSTVTVLVLGCAMVGRAGAAPDDVFLQAEPTTGELTSFRAEASYDMVNRAVDVFNAQGSHGAAPENAGNYRGGKLLIGYKFSPQWSAAATYWRRGIDYGPDNNQINSWLLAVHYDPLAEPGARDRVIFRLALWGDYSPSLQRTTSFHVRDTLLNGVAVRNANDVQAQADMVVSGELDMRNQLTGFFGLGISRVSIGGINTQVQQGICRFNVGIGTDNVANGMLAAPCRSGDVTVNSASFTGNASQFGLDVDKDFNYTAGFLNLGAAWRWKYERFAARLGYQFQYLVRSNVDDRAASYGYGPIKSNHTLGLEVSYAMGKGVEAFLRGQASRYNFVGTVPFLYNAAMAGRLDRYYGYASIGIRYSGF